MAAVKVPLRQPRAGQPVEAVASLATPPLPPVAATAAARLSVIIPVYNERNTLRELLERVRTQGIAWQERPVELEIVVVDDCS
ncbi:MAG TPA: glycosyltransferase, partial [Chloroflexota bacterium]|nr:glycosyltransferase [Chloroflexota bacterium]